MRKADTKTMAARVLVSLAAAALPWVFHPSVLIALLFLTPVICACMRAAGWKGLGVAYTALLALSAALSGQAEQVCQLAWLWCLVTLLMESMLRKRGHRKQVKDWTVFTVIIGCAGVVMLREYYGGAVVDGLAEAITAWVDNLKDAERVLLTLYGMGYARLTGEMAQVPALQLFGEIIMSPQVHVELVNSLRTTLRYLLSEQLLEWVATFLVVQVLLTAILPEVIRRKRGEPTELEMVHRLHMNRQQARGICLLMLFGLVRLFTSSVAVYQAAGMAMTTFGVLFGAQGVCLIVSWLRKADLSLRSWGVVIILVLLMLPAAGTILLLLGAYDQFADPRKLRVKEIKDIEGGT